jgi:hypothetical protein
MCITHHCALYPTSELFSTQLLLVSSAEQFCLLLLICSYFVSGEPSRMIDVPRQSSGQQIVRFPRSATMNQPPQPAVRSSTHQFLRQPSMITQEGAMNTSGRSASTLTSAPPGVMVTRIPHRTPAPHLQALFNRLPASHHGAARLER